MIVFARKMFAVARAIHIGDLSALVHRSSPGPVRTMENIDLTGPAL
jgi:hypothetical protein